MRGPTMTILLRIVRDRNPQLASLAARLAWCSYMMHVYDGFSAHEVPAVAPHLDAEGLLGKKLLEDGRELHVEPTTYGRARLCLTNEHCRLSYTDVYCYLTPARALEAMRAWNGEGEPDGWHRHPQTGRRREDGDPSRERVHL